jgi:hypothetical protein
VDYFDYGQLRGSSEYCNEPSSSVEGEEILCQHSDCNFSREIYCSMDLAIGYINMFVPIEYYRQISLWKIESTSIILSRVCVDYIRRVLDWELDLLDHTQLHTITVYTLYNSQQLSLFSSSEDFGSNSATTAATSSYGIPCHYSLTGCLNQPTVAAISYIAGERTVKKTPPKIPLLLHGLPIVACLFVRCLATVNKSFHCRLLT